MNFPTNKYGDPSAAPRQPLNVQGGGLMIYSQSEDITYNGKVAAGAITEVQLNVLPILTPLGDRVGSYWGKTENLAYQKQDSVSIIETDGAAVAVIVEQDKNLENLFESLSGTVKRYVMKVTDKRGNSLYGWIRLIGKVGDAYTFQIFNHRLLETDQNWVGNQADFDEDNVVKAEIFRYTSSIAFGTGTTLVEEVEMPYEFGTIMENVYKAIDGLADGQFFADYLRGFIIGRKADGTASETITYNTYLGQTGDVLNGGGGGVPEAWGIEVDRKVVALAGTPEALTAISTPFRTLTIQALRSNTDYTMIGSLDVLEAAPDDVGIALASTQSYHFAVPGDLADIFIDVGTNGEGVSFLYTT